MNHISKTMMMLLLSIVFKNQMQAATPLEQDIVREKQDEQMLNLIQQDIESDKAKIAKDMPTTTVETKGKLSAEFITQYSTGNPCKGIDEAASNKKNGTSSWLPDFNMMALLKISTKIQQEYPMLNNDGVKAATIKYIDNYDPKGENAAYIKGAKGKINNLVFKK